MCRELLPLYDGKLRRLYLLPEGMFPENLFRYFELDFAEMDVLRFLFMSDWPLLSGFSFFSSINVQTPSDYPLSTNP